MYLFLNGSPEIGLLGADYDVISLGHSAFFLVHSSDMVIERRIEGIFRLSCRAFFGFSLDLGANVACNVIVKLLLEAHNSFIAFVIFINCIRSCIISCKGKLDEFIFSKVVFAEHFLQSFQVVGTCYEVLLRVHKFSDIVLSFAAGVMLAAAVLGLILPSLEYGGELGIIMTVIFSAAAAYLGLKVGQVFEAAIPIAIIAVGLSSGLNQV